ncbi:hypothetical protein PQQ75_06125 [Paraburkholderia aspalathi]|uniref:hypothetical protein n=1 Tax=Paraburkholderia aspalathi TaxID=1324617 RepID=UPI0038B8FEE2
MPNSSKYVPKLDTSSDQPSRRRNLLTVLALAAGALVLAGCGGEGSGDINSPAVAADAVAPGAVANAATNVAGMGEVANDTPAGVGGDSTSGNGESPNHNRVVLRKSGQGD